MEMMIRRHLARVNYNVVTNAFAGRFVTLAEDIVFRGRDVAATARGWGAQTRRFSG